MSRVVERNDNLYFDQLQQMIEDVDQMKSPQTIGGGSFVIRNNYPTVNPAYVGIVSGSLTIARWRVVFTPATASLRPYTELEYNATVSPDNGFNTFESYADPGAINSTSPAYIIELPNGNLDDVTVTISAGIKSIDTGTVTITRIL
jgi:hypothetical protein